MFRTRRAINDIESLGLDVSPIDSKHLRIWDSSAQGRYLLSGFIKRRRGNPDIIAYMGIDEGKRGNLRGIAGKYGLSFRCVLSASDGMLVYERDGEIIEEEGFDGKTCSRYLLSD